MLQPASLGNVTPMFSYRPPKGSCWGCAIRPRSAVKAIEKMHAFLNTYFEPIRPEGLTLNLNPYLDKDHDVPKLKARADQVFGRTGRPDSLDWVFGPDDFGRVMEFILESKLNPKAPADPIWLSFTCRLNWKDSILPKAVADEEMVAAPLFIVNLSSGGSIMFPAGIYIPIPPDQPGTYEFLGQFSADAPFKMSVKHFQARIPNSRGTMVWKKPDGQIAMRLNEAIGSHG